MVDKQEHNENNQVAKFREAARDSECDEDEARWEERLKKIAQAKPDEQEKPE